MANSFFQAKKHVISRSSGSHGSSVLSTTDGNATGSDSTINYLYDSDTSDTISIEFLSRAPSRMRTATAELETNRKEELPRCASLTSPLSDVAYGCKNRAFNHYPGSCKSSDSSPVTISEATDSDATDSDATDSDVTDSDATDSDATDSDVTDSDATDSDVTIKYLSDSDTSDTISIEFLSRAPSRMRTATAELEKKREEVLPRCASLTSPLSDDMCACKNCAFTHNPESIHSSNSSISSRVSSCSNTSETMPPANVIDKVRLYL